MLHEKNTSNQLTTDRPMSKLEEVTATVETTNANLTRIGEILDQIGTQLFGVQPQDDPSKVMELPDGQMHRLTSTANYSANKSTEVLNQIMTLKDML